MTLHDIRINAPVNLRTFRTDRGRWGSFAPDTLYEHNVFPEVPSGAFPYARTYVAGVHTATPTGQTYTSNHAPYRASGVRYTCTLSFFDMPEGRPLARVAFRGEPPGNHEVIISGCSIVGGNPPDVRFDCCRAAAGTGAAERVYEVRPRGGKHTKVACLDASRVQLRDCTDCRAPTPHGVATEGTRLGTWATLAALAGAGYLVFGVEGPLLLRLGWATGAFALLPLATWLFRGTQLALSRWVARCEVCGSGILLADQSGPPSSAPRYTSSR